MGETGRFVGKEPRQKICGDLAHSPTLCLSQNSHFYHHFPRDEQITMLHNFLEYTVGFVVLQILQNVSPGIFGAQEEPHVSGVDLLPLQVLVGGLVHMDFQVASVRQSEFVQRDDQLVIKFDL